MSGRLITLSQAASALGVTGKTRLLIRSKTLTRLRALESEHSVKLIIEDRKFHVDYDGNKRIFRYVDAGMLERVLPGSVSCLAENLALLADAFERRVREIEFRLEDLEEKVNDIA